MHTPFGPEGYTNDPAPRGLEPRRTRRIRSSWHQAMPALSAGPLRLLSFSLPPNDDSAFGPAPPSRFWVWVVWLRLRPFWVHRSWAACRPAWLTLGHPRVAVVWLFALAALPVWEGQVGLVWAALVAGA